MMLSGEQKMTYAANWCDFIVQMRSMLVIRQACERAARVYVSVGAYKTQITGALVLEGLPPKDSA